MTVVHKRESEGLQGKLFPWNPVTREPRFVKLAGSDPRTAAAFLMFFSDERKLHELMAFLEVSGYTVETLQTVEFLGSLPKVHEGLPVKTAVDPEVSPSGKLWMTVTL
jgi:hypothetical protein